MYLRVPSFCNSESYPTKFRHFPGKLLWRFLRHFAHDVFVRVCKRSFLNDIFHVISPHLYNRNSYQASSSVFVILCGNLLLFLLSGRLTGMFVHITSEFCYLRTYSPVLPRAGTTKDPSVCWYYWQQVDNLFSCTLWIVLQDSQRPARWCKGNVRHFSTQERCTSRDYTNLVTMC